MTGLPQLLCGLPTGDGLGKAALNQLDASLAKFTTRAVDYLEAPESQDITTFGPFCGRVVLENGCAALLGRLDPFRLLYLSEFQSQPGYPMGKRVRSAFAWAGDVIPEERPNGSLWDADQDVPKISRSLFSRHLEHIYWKPALVALLDHIADDTSPELADIAQLDTEHFIDSAKGRCMQLYSQLSKGVHWEFFSSALEMDELTTKTLLRDTLVEIAALGLISHFVPTAYASLSPDAAVAAYIEFRKIVK